MTQSFKLMNLHNHTKWSDGKHSVQEIIEHAIKNNINKIAITDHYETNKVWPTDCLQPKKIPAYMQEIKQLKARYQGKIEVNVGIEICMSRSYCKLDQLPYTLFNQMDFVLLEYVEDTGWGDVVMLEDLGQYIEPITVPIGLAHTNLLPLAEEYGAGYVVQKLNEYNLFWELNVSNRYTYATSFLSQQETPQVKALIALLKQSGIQITVGADTHSIEKDYNHEAVLRAHEFLAAYYH